MLTRRNWMEALAALSAMRAFGQTGAADGPNASGASAGRTMIGVPFEKRPVVRFGVIGTGGRGTEMIREMLALENVEIRAICDVNRDAALTAVAKIQQAGKTPPEAYTGGDRDFENLVQRDDLDFVYIATPWDWHVPMALAAMAAGKHCGTEVPAATTLQGCWDLVNASEKTRRHCLIMENCCYGEMELLLIQLVKAGAMGRLIHGEAGYLHDLREELLSNRGEGLWRRKPHTERNGNLYPTHGLGPIANTMAVNRGDQFDFLVSMSSLQCGLEDYRDAHLPPGDSKRAERYVEGDMNSSLIRTAMGRTILLQHDVVNARPYSRLNRLQGSKGLFEDYPPRIYLDGQAGGEKFTSLEPLANQYRHPLWKRVGDLAARNGGHGGMDFVLLYRLVECLREGLVPDIDVYDAAAWSVPGPLSVASVRAGSAPQQFPDFTRGLWRQRRGWLV